LVLILKWLFWFNEPNNSKRKQNSFRTIIKLKQKKKNSSCCSFCCCLIFFITAQRFERLQFPGGYGLFGLNLFIITILIPFSLSPIFRKQSTNQKVFFASSSLCHVALKSS
jgi:hypothetical protein